MKILHIILGLGKGGAERLLVNSLPKYVAMGFEVDLLQISSRYEYQGHIDILQNNNVSIFSLTSGSAKSFKLIFKLRRFLKQNEYDIVHVHLFPSLYYSFLATRFLGVNTKFVFTEHSSQNRRSNKWYLRIIEKFVYSSYDKVVAVSDSIKLRLLTDLNLKNVATVYNGVSLEVFDTAKPFTTTYWSNLCSIKPSSIKILMVARFSYPKDHTTALRALTKLPEDYVLLVAGDGKGIAKIKMLAKELDISHRLHFLGFRIDIPEIMKSADIIILPTNYEGMSGVGLEAMASKTNFLGADVTGIKEVVPDGRYLFNKNDDQQLSQKIMQLAPKNQMSINMSKIAYSHVKQFSLDKMVQEYAEIYKTLSVNLEKSIQFTSTQLKER